MNQRISVINFLNHLYKILDHPLWIDIGLHGAGLYHSATQRAYSNPAVLSIPDASMEGIPAYDGFLVKVFNRNRFPVRLTVIFRSGITLPPVVIQPRSMTYPLHGHSVLPYMEGLKIRIEPCFETDKKERTLYIDLHYGLADMSIFRLYSLAVLNPVDGLYDAFVRGVYTPCSTERLMYPFDSINLSGPTCGPNTKTRQQERCMLLKDELMGFTREPYQNQNQPYDIV